MMILFILGLSLFNILMLLIMLRYVTQEENNITVSMATLSKNFDIHREHLKKDIRVWTGGTDQLRKEFKGFEKVYIHHMSQVNERLKQLEGPETLKFGQPMKEAKAV